MHAERYGWSAGYWPTFHIEASSIACLILTAVRTTVRHGTMDLAMYGTLR